MTIPHRQQYATPRSTMGLSAARSLRCARPYVRCPGITWPPRRCGCRRRSSGDLTSAIGRRRLRCWP